MSLHNSGAKQSEVYLFMQVSHCLWELNIRNTVLSCSAVSVRLSLVDVWTTFYDPGFVLLFRSVCSFL